MPHNNAFAIVGLACRLPSTVKVSEHGDVDLSAKTPLPAWRDWLKKNHVVRSPTGHWLDKPDIEEMDPLFFNISPGEAPTMRPAARLALELTYQAFEDACIPPSIYKGSKCAAVFASSAEGFDKVVFVNRAFRGINRYYGTGATVSTLAGRVSHYFDLKGPSAVIESTSGGGAKALHQGISSILSGESDMAVVSEICLQLWPYESQTSCIEHAAVAIIKPLHAITKSDRIRGVIHYRSDPSSSVLDSNLIFQRLNHCPPFTVDFDHSTYTFSNLSTTSLDRNELQRQPPVHLLTISAKTAAAHKQLCTDYRIALQQSQSLQHVADICFSANTGRETFAYRSVHLGSSAQELISTLDSPHVDAPKIPTETVLFLNGHISIKTLMSLIVNLQNESAFSTVFDTCLQTFHRLQPKNADHPALIYAVLTFSYLYSAASLLESCGMSSAYVMGTGVGDLVSACIAAGTSITQALDILCHLYGTSPPSRAYEFQGMPDQVSEQLKTAGISLSMVSNSQKNTVIITPDADVDRIPRHMRYKSVDINDVSSTISSWKAEPSQQSKSTCKYISIRHGCECDPQVALTYEFWAKAITLPADVERAFSLLKNKNLAVLDPGKLRQWIVHFSLSAHDDALSIPSINKDRRIGFQGAFANTLAKCFLLNVPVKFSAYYREHGLMATAIPQYPFQRRRFWPDVIEDDSLLNVFSQAHEPVDAESSYLEDNEPRSSNGRHLLVGKAVSHTGEGSVFEQVLDEQAMNLLKDHAVNNQLIFPAAGLVEIALTASRMSTGANLALRELTMLSPLVLKHQTTIRVVVKKDVVEIFGRQPPSDYVLVARGTMVPNAAKYPEPILPSASERLRSITTQQDIYSCLDQLQYGPHFRNVRKVDIYKNFIRVEAELDSATSSSFPTSDFTLHPALLDACMHAIGCKERWYDPQDDSQMLPIQFKNVAIIRPMPSKIICIWRLNPAHQDSKLRKSASAMIYDQNMDLVAVVGLFASRRTKMRELQSGVVDDFEKPRRTLSLQSKSSQETLSTLVPASPTISLDVFASKFRQSEPNILRTHYLWKPTSLTQRIASIRCDEVLIFADEEGLGRLLLDKCITLNLPVIYVRQGKEFSSERRFLGSGIHLLTIDPTDIEHYKMIPKPQGKRLLLHLWSLDIQTMENALLGCISATYALQQFLDAQKSLETVWITRKTIYTGDNNVTVEQAPLVGLLRTMRREVPQVPFYQLDFDNVDVSTVWNEILNRGASKTIVYRKAQRYCPKLTVLPAPSSPEINFAGTWILTGFGQVVLKLAKWISDHGGSVVAISRTVPSKPVPYLRFVQADVTDFEAMSLLIDSIRGPICGVVHGAGTLRDAGIRRQTQSTFDQVFHAKAIGALVLHQLLGARVQYFVMLSGFGTTVGNPGQANYTAANSFLDAFAEYRHSLGMSAVSLQLGPIKGTKMAAPMEKADRASSIVSTMAFEDALPVIQQALRDQSTYPVQGIADLDLKVLEKSPGISDDPCYANVRVNAYSSKGSPADGLTWQSKTPKWLRDWSSSNLPTPTRSASIASSVSSASSMSADLNDEMTSSLSAIGSPKPDFLSDLLGRLNEANSSRRASVDTRHKVGSLLGRERQNKSLGVDPSPSAMSAASLLGHMDVAQSPSIYGNITASQLFERLHPKADNNTWDQISSRGNLTSDHPNAQRRQSTQVSPESRTHVQTLRSGIDSSMLLAGQLQPDEASEDVDQAFKSIIGNLLEMDVEMMELDEPMLSYGIDSIAITQIRSDVSSRFGVDVPQAFLTPDRTLSEVLEFVKASIKKNPSSRQGSIKDERIPAQIAGNQPNQQQSMHTFAPEVLSTAYDKPSSAVKGETSSGAVDQAFKGIIGHLLEMDGEAMELDEPMLSYGIDSIAITQIRSDVNTRFGVDIPQPFLTPDRTLSEVLEYIKANIQKDPASRQVSMKKTERMPSRQQQGMHALAPEVLSTAYDKPSSAVDNKEESDAAVDQAFKSILGHLLEMDAEAMELDEPMLSYGIDSIAITQIRSDVNTRFGVDIPQPYLTPDRTLLEVLKFVKENIKKDSAAGQVSMKKDEPIPAQIVGHQIESRDKFATSKNVPPGQDQTVEDAIANIICELLEMERPYLDLDEAMLSYGIDSIAFNQLVAKVKDLYHVEIPSAFGDASRTLRDMVTWVQQAV